MWTTGSGFLFVLWMFFEVDTLCLSHLCEDPTRLAAAKGVQVWRRCDALIIAILAAVVFLPLLISGIILVSITWTHRPDLSAFDILREAIKEIKIIMCRKPRQKGIRK